MANGSAARDRALNGALHNAVLVTEGDSVRAPAGEPRWSVTTTLLWSIMMLLATAIAGYGFWLLASPAARPPFLKTSPVPLAMLAHFGGSGLALLLGPWQFISGRSRRRSTTHVWSGRVYVIAAVVGTAAGLVLAPFSQGGLTGHLGFGALGILTLGATLRAYLLVRQGNVAEHRRWMLRSFALILAAVTLRLQLPGALIAGIAFERAYPVIAWACWVPNLLVAEWMLRRQAAVGDSPT